MKKIKKIAILKKNEDFIIFEQVEDLEHFPFKEILKLAEETKKELIIQLLRDAIFGDQFINNIKISDGLEFGLTTLYNFHPILPAYLKTQEQLSKTILILA